ncbi:sarcosine oxidase subunit beta family protein [Labrys monachus]|uniref:Sarcosine oxidase subunit beta n=1 Tax=Labrys monachus TaxID=217067 RepID=A0ABU0F7Y7_9HYPH|nr:sarcosine oxidase subunit beta family protein [Labrys monachus]MDQ0390724.1 sarcosine oxidase subunit beta [Labrys monachus]
MLRYSGFRLAYEALRGHRGWGPAWRKAAPKASYDVVIVGGGGHGLATAYYLAKNHGITDVAVIERGGIGLGNVGRNTTIIRSNYFSRENIRFYDFSLKLWEGLEADLNYNAMVSQRGALNLVHADGQRDLLARRANMMRLEGVDTELLDKVAVKRLVPLIDTENGRFPVLGGFLQRRGGTVRHDAVAWGYARAADARGVDIVEQCEVTGIRREGGAVAGVETTRGFVGARKVVLAVAGHSSRLAEMAGFRLPIETHVLQAFVSEGVKPLIDLVVTYGAGHFYISQSDKGGLVFGGALDGYNTYARRGSLPMVEDVLAAGVTLMPGLGRLRVLRQWGGAMDMSLDGNPIIAATPVTNLYLNGGWCYGGFKAIPAGGFTTAYLVATGAPHPLIAHFGLERFRDGRVIDERGVGPYAWAH